MRLRHAAFLAAVLVAGCFAVASAASTGRSSGKARVQLSGSIPRAVATRADHAVMQHVSSDKMTLNFAFPLHNKAGLNALIQQEATTHHYLSRAQIYGGTSSGQVGGTSLAAPIMNGLQAHSPELGGIGSPGRVDGTHVDPLVIECLQCGTSRLARRDRFKHFEAPECPECGYLGWAPVLEVKETDRSAPAELAHAEHRLPSVA